jgi:UDP-N-acetylglucosamine 4,6-dehydratase (inverting)
MAYSGEVVIKNMEDELDNQSILVTGGTGSFGHAFVKATLDKFNPKKLIVFSRDEMKQWEMSKRYAEDSRVRFFIGDVRDKDRLARATTGVDIVIHAAATKIVPTAEYNPFEAIKTNIMGAMNLVDVSIDNGVKKVVALSTDKASSPINLYGATKLVSDKLFIAGNNYAGAGPTRFSVVRYGNVMGSRGSVIPFFLSKKGSGVLPITDPEMTRFMISLDQGVGLVWKALEDMKGGEIYVKKIPSMRVVDIASTIAPNAKLEIIGIRPGEKIHEQMIGPEDAPNTFDCGDFYKIYPETLGVDLIDTRAHGGTKVGEGFTYASDSNTEWMAEQDLRKWLELNSDEEGNVPLH